MKLRRRSLLASLLILGLPLAACQKPHAAHEAEHPAEVEAIEGTDLRRVTLTERAMERIDVGTSEVREQPVSRSATPRLVVPHASLIYDAQGQTWIYVSPQPRTFVRHKVAVDYIEGDLAVLHDGPAAGTVIASRAVAELYGTDFGVGH